ncbi:efflux RND transporter periplasmic adaptor subunit [Natronoflexus pectinivorans]|uniref:HlyD family secretion protein n=1 Tax=Natronoflexus pectinivorans TaxID=682526 RepID=A0A4R2GK47_9BACT|nr:efflux RND transporter periplasmic adaptor subunit [Natronoflexus pectinivorans]TCO08444.1 HlyD family secretion protein [Natronoflexus pectinivorans]
MKRFFKILGLLVFVGLVLWVFVYLYKQSKSDPVVFDTETPFTTDIINKTVATGSVIPRREIAIKPQENGIIREIYVDPGDRVKEGDLIARIQIIPEMIEVNAAESRLNKAQLEYENARIEFERKKGLFEQNVIARSEFEAEELRYRTRLEDLNAADNHLQLIQEGVTRKMGAQTNTLIRSTIDGMVLDVPVREGNSVIRTNAFNEGTTIAIVADMNEMIFEGKVDETEVGRISEGMHLLLTIGALQGDSFDAYLEYISPKGQEESGAIQFEIRAAVKLQEGSFIRAGYSANADIVLDRRDSVLAVTERVLQFNGDSIFVEIETAPQTFEKRVVKTGLSDGLNIEIKEGVSENDKVKVPRI